MAFKSLDTKIATVNKNGWVTGVSEGRTRIKIAIRYNDNKQDILYWPVHVVENHVLRVSYGNQELKHKGVLDVTDNGKKMTIQLNVKRCLMFNPIITYKIYEADGSRAKFASIDKNGKITINNRLGTLKIVVTAKSDNDIEIATETIYLKIKTNNKFQYAGVGQSLTSPYKIGRIKYNKNYASYNKRTEKLTITKAGKFELEVYDTEEELRHIYTVRGYNVVNQKLKSSIELRENVFG